MLVFMALKFEKSRCRVERNSLLLVQADGAQVFARSSAPRQTRDMLKLRSRRRNRRIAARVPTLSALAPAGGHPPTQTKCQAGGFRRRESHRRHLRTGSAL